MTSSPRNQEFEDALLLLDFPTTQKGKEKIQRSEPIAIPTTSSNLYPDSERMDIKREEDTIQDDLLLAASLLIKSSSQDHQPYSILHEQTGQLSSSASPKKKKGVEKKKKKVTLSPSLHPAEGLDRKCDYCEATVTPMWRHGPPGYEDLCNKVREMYFN
jgi:hypothetical protein